MPLFVVVSATHTHTHTHTQLGLLVPLVEVTPELLCPLPVPIPPKYTRCGAVGACVSVGVLWVLWVVDVGLV